MATPAWVKDAVFYQIFPDRFARSRRVEKPSNLEPWDSPPTRHGFKGGDLRGVAERLDYLQDLGVTALYLNPVFTSTANHRYHTYDYLSVDPLLGGTPALRELLDAAHARRMRVVLDGVFNHAGRGFYQFNHTLENGAASPYLDWFHFDRERLRSGRALNAYPGDEGPGRDLGYEAWWNLPALPRLNTRTPAVRDFIFDVATRWVDFGIDGWRLDVPEEIDDDSFWQEFRLRVKRANPDAYIVGEIWGDARRWLAGDQFDAVMNYLFTKAVLAWFIADPDLELIRATAGYRSLEPLDQEAFTAAIERLLELYDPAVTLSQLNLLDSHDTPRFLSCARGEEAALRLAVLFLFTYPGVPCIYYGDETGMSGREDPDCRRAFSWDEGSWNSGLRDHYRRCAALRSSHPALRRGSFERLLSRDGIFAFARRDRDAPVIVVLNTSGVARKVSIPLGGGTGEVRRLRDAWGTGEFPAADGMIRDVTVAPRTGLVLEPSR